MLLLIMKRYSKLLSSLENELSMYPINPQSIVRNSKKALQITHKHQKEMRNLVNSIGFESQEDEINFFKNVKSGIVSNLFFYSFILDTSLRIGQNDKVALKKEVQREFGFIIKKHYEFYHYFKSDGSHLDHYYFLRKDTMKSSLPLCVQSQYDPNYSTGYDILLARIKAYDKIQAFLMKDTNECNLPSLTWTSSKAALVELIYALHSSGSINHGKLEIKEISKVFEQVLEIDLGDIYRTFYDICGRKVEGNLFIQQLDEVLTRKKKQYL